MKTAKISIIFILLLVPLAVLAQGSCEAGGAGSSKLCNPLGAGITDLKAFGIYTLVTFGAFTVLIPIAQIVFAGMAMLVSQGNAESVERAKKSFTWTIYGFILAVLCFVLIQSMINFLGATQIPDPSNPSSQTEIVNPLAESDFGAFVKRMIVNFLQVAGVLAVLMFIFNGFRYITAGGNEEQVKQGKDALKWSAAGVIVILLAYVIVRATATLLGLPQ